MLTSVRGVSIGHNSLSFPELSTLSRDQTNRMPRQFPEVAVAGLPTADQLCKLPNISKRAGCLPLHLDEA